MARPPMSTILHTKSENLLRKPMFEHTAVSRILEKHVISMGQLSFEKVMTHVQENKRPSLHLCQFIRPVLIIHSNIEPTPRCALNTSNHQSWSMPRRQLKLPRSVPRSMVIPAIPQITRLNSPHVPTSTTPCERHRSTEQLHDIGTRRTARPARRLRPQRGFHHSML